MKPIHDLLGELQSTPKAPKAVQGAVPAKESKTEKAFPMDIEILDPAVPPGKKARGSGLQYAKERAAMALKNHARDANDFQPLQLSFPQWNEDRRGVPNSLIRGGLFTTRRTLDREQINKGNIVSLSNIALNYSGEELRQDDLTVWLAIVHAGRGQALGEPIYFTAYQLIKDMKWRMHSESYEKLRACIERMKLTSLQMRFNRERSGYGGSLIRDFAFDAIDEDGNASWMVRLETNIANLFSFDQTTLFEWEQRREIGTRATLTLWLHTFYSSHLEPMAYSVAKIHELCKSEEKKLSNFKIRLRQSLERLVEIGFLDKYHITNDTVHVTRRKVPSALLRAA